MQKLVQDVRVDECFIDVAHHGGGYQRDQADRAVKTALEFDEDRFEVVVVSERTRIPGPNRYAVIDGGMRLLMAQALMFETVVADVRAMSRTEEADLFVKLAQGRKGLIPIQVFAGELAAGDPEAVALNALCEQLGFRICQSRTPFSIEAVAALKKARKMLGPDTAQMLCLLKPWGEDGPVKKQAIEGMATFLHRYGDQIDHVAAKKKFATVPQDQVIRAARQRSADDTDGGVLATFFCQQLVALYNKGRKKNRIVPREYAQSHEYVLRD